MSPSPKIPGTNLEPLWRFDAMWPEVTDDFEQTCDYLNWYVGINYPYVVSITC